MRRRPGSPWKQQGSAGASPARGRRAELRAGPLGPNSLDADPARTMALRCDLEQVFLSTRGHPFEMGTVIELNSRGLFLKCLAHRRLFAIKLNVTLREPIFILG